MFTTIFQDHYIYLAICALVAVVLGTAAWLLSSRLGSTSGMWFAGLTATTTGVLGVTFLGSGPASGQCIVNHDLVEPFRTTQGLWNLAMTIPLGFFALMAIRRPLPALVGVIALPLAIEFTQAEVDGLGRVCDSTDAQMNILGGLLGLLIAILALTRHRVIQWRGAAKSSITAFIILLIFGTGVAQPALSFTHVDGTSLSTASSEQRQAVERAVKEAFGEHYELGPAYNQPCTGAPCGSVAFTLLSRDKENPEAAPGNLSWPDRKHLNVLLEDSDRPGLMGYPMDGAKAPSNEDEAYQIAYTYMRAHYPWGTDAIARKTYPIGEKAQLGWMTSWRWVDDDTLMPRMLDVQVDRAGRVSQVDVTLGPKQLDLEKAKLDAKQAESLVRAALSNQLADQGGLPKDVQIKAFTRKAVERDGAWRPTWLVSISAGVEGTESAPATAGMSDLWNVDAVSGQLFSDFGQPIKEK
ncbi:VanZ family protein [Streptomyces sp. NPDC013171]|uniref:VanZ family protein n=1 Tax=Streptomyces sp. NPDC013171 TaxID=3364863 RepID=UPI0036A74EC9